MLPCASKNNVSPLHKCSDVVRSRLFTSPVKFESSPTKTKMSDQKEQSPVGRVCSKTRSFNTEAQSPDNCHLPYLKRGNSSAFPNASYHALRTKLFSTPVKKSESAFKKIDCQQGSGSDNGDDRNESDEVMLHFESPTKNDAGGVAVYSILSDHQIEQKTGVSEKLAITTSQAQESITHYHDENEILQSPPQKKYCTRSLRRVIPNSPSKIIPQNQLPLTSSSMQTPTSQQNMKYGLPSFQLRSRTKAKQKEEENNDLGIQASDDAGAKSLTLLSDETDHDQISKICYTVRDVKHENAAYAQTEKSDTLWSKEREPYHLEPSFVIDQNLSTDSFKEKHHIKMSVQQFDLSISRKFVKNRRTSSTQIAGETTSSTLPSHSAMPSGVSITNMKQSCNNLEFGSPRKRRNRISKGRLGSRSLGLPGASETHVTTVSNFEDVLQKQELQNDFVQTTPERRTRNHSDRHPVNTPTYADSLIKQKGRPTNLPFCSSNKDVTSPLRTTPESSTKPSKNDFSKFGTPSQSSMLHLTFSPVVSDCGGKHTSKTSQKSKRCIENDSKDFNIN